MNSEPAWHLRNAENELKAAQKDLPAAEAHNIEAAIQIIKGVGQKTPSWGVNENGNDKG